ncbi:MAG: phage/plasmid primase, P4 family, partial [Pseudomonadota bacterium]
MSNDVYRDLMGDADDDHSRKPVEDAPPPPPRRANWLASPSGHLATDIGNGGRLAEALDGEVIYVIGKGWAVRDGARYSFRGDAVRAQDAAAVLPKLIRTEADAAAALPVTNQDVDDVLAGRLGKAAPFKANSVPSAVTCLRLARRNIWDAWAVKCESLERIKKGLEVAKPALLRDIEDLDADPWSLTVPNGRVDLRAAIAADLDNAEALEPEEELDARAAWLKPQDWSTLPTKCAGVAYDPAATCPRFLDFLALIQPTEEARAFLQRALGLLIFGRNYLQVALMMKGGGGNGKSTLMNAIGHALGRRDGYFEAVNVAMFLFQRQEDPGKATPHEVGIPGARAIVASETAPTDEFSGKKIKSMTGGDERQCRGMFKEAFKYTPRAVPVISFNDSPTIRENDEGTRRRLVFIPFPVNLRDLPPDQAKSEEQAEAELKAEAAGILNWLIDGFVRVRRDGLRPTEDALTQKAREFSTADPVATFIDQCLDRDPAGRIGVKVMHAGFVAWCDIAGETP